MKLFLLVFFVFFGPVFPDDITELCKTKYVSYKKTRTAADYPQKFLSLYASNLTAIREATFMNNCRDIELHNRKEGISYTKGINQFTDWTEEEFLSILQTPPPAVTPNITFAPLPESKPSFDELDLRKFDVVNPPRTEGQCGACWALAATVSFEINYGLKFGRTECSEKYLLDCTPGSSCNGGWYMDAWKNLIEHHDGQFPARDGYDKYDARYGKCHEPTKIAGTISRYFKVKSESQMASVLENYGAMSIGVDASSWSSYRGGLFRRSCSHRLNHACIVIGYGNQNGVPYWLIQNTWGSKWGENGYMKLLRGANHCGVASQAYVPVADRA